MEVKVEVNEQKLEEVKMEVKVEVNEQRSWKLKWNNSCTKSITPC